MDALKKSLEEKDAEVYPMKDTEKQEPNEVEKETKKKEVTKKESKTEKSPSKIKQKLNQFKQWFKRLKKWQKIVLIGWAIIIPILLILLLIFVLGGNVLFCKATVQGYIYEYGTESDKVGVENAKVCVEENCAFTDSNGWYTLKEVKCGDRKITVEHADFITRETPVTLEKGDNTVDIYIDPAGFSAIEGTFAVEGDEFITEDLKLFIDGTEVTLSEDKDNTVYAEDITVGEHMLKIESPYYMDETFDFTLSLDQIEEERDYVDVGEFTLTPAGDVVFNVVDWLSNNPVQEASVTYNGDTVTSNDTGGIEAKDFEIGKEITFEISPDGYLAKTKKATIKQGVTNLKNVSVVRAGNVVYVSNRLGNQNVYISNYDGSGEVLLSDNQGDSYSPYLTPDGKTVYFLSTRENVKGEYGYTIPLVYSVSSSGGPISKVSQTTYDDYGSIGAYDFESMKRTYVKSVYDDVEFTNTSTLFWSNINGTGSVQLTEMLGWINGVKPSQKGDFLIFGYSKPDYGTESSGVYRIDPQSKEKTLIYGTVDQNTAYPLDVSPDGSKALVQIYDNENVRWDLWIIGIFDESIVRITNSSAEELQARFSPDGTSVTFMSMRDNKRNVYKVDSSGSNETKLTDKPMVDDYFWGRNGVLFFNSNQAMWIVDVNYPAQSQKVTESVLGTYYSYQYNYYYGE